MIDRLAVPRKQLRIAGKNAAVGSRQSYQGAQALIVEASIVVHEPQHLALRDLCRSIVGNCITRIPSNRQPPRLGVPLHEFLTCVGTTVIDDDELRAWICLVQERAQAVVQKVFAVIVQYNC